MKGLACIDILGVVEENSHNAILVQQPHKLYLRFYPNIYDLCIYTCILVLQLQKRNFPIQKLYKIACKCILAQIDT